MPANLRVHSNPSLTTSEQAVLYLALELGWEGWKLAFATGPGAAPRRREVLGRRWAFQFSPRQAPLRGTTDRRPAIPRAWRRSRKRHPLG